MKLDIFKDRHIGPDAQEYKEMLMKIGVSSIEELIQKTIPDSIRLEEPLDLPEAMSEYEYLRELKQTAQKNKVYRSYIGQGYCGTITPSVILRNVFENPGWYTQYTPYQAEIAQGRLEALLNFQTMVADLTGLPLANASLLDEGTAAAEAMIMAYGVKNKRTKEPIKKFFIDKHIFEQTKEVLIGRAIPLGIEVIEGDYKTATIDEAYFGALVQYPNAIGSVESYESFAQGLKNNDQLLVIAADILSLSVLKSPGSWGADVVVGSTQRFGVPMGFGGPHAAYLATTEKYKRQIPGRIIGVSQDRQGNRALRMALQTREQHIKREKATSNICTAQALLAIMASMYACYHGPKGIQGIGLKVQQNAQNLYRHLKSLEFNVLNNTFFDTVTIEASESEIEQIKSRAKERMINFFFNGNNISICIDETVSQNDLEDIKECFNIRDAKTFSNGIEYGIAESMLREVDYMTHPVFNTHHTETQMMRYIKSLENKDLSLVHSMIALGSCTMKLNAASELIPVSWPEFGQIHPFAPADQTLGYQQVFDELNEYLSKITGFAGCTLQPNSGAQGEYAGLMMIRAYHLANNDAHRDIVLIPSSAHGTNPASAVMAGMKVVVTACDDQGNIALDDLKEKIEAHKDNLAGIMITYPSTHGVFEEDVIEICDSIHDAGGLVYMDGANMNAQVGLTSPGAIHADCCHLNLHKTFAIPHGGGGPGMGPVCVNEKLLPFLPGHPYADNKETAIKPISAANWGSASILLISYAYIKMLGVDGVKESTEAAILNANYIKSCLASNYDVLYTNKNGFCAHELIIDLRDFKDGGVSAEDVAKRLIDYGFHAPTLSFPVPGTIMIEPTESENKDELDRFIAAMNAIRKEIDQVTNGEVDKEDNVLNNAPHPIHEITADDWTHQYSRSDAAYPLPYLKGPYKFWASVARVDNAYGDRNLICTCPPMEAYI
ncbi:MAG: aminomethyl-transferring glycine dehydrogenase [Saprospiraceae bacterium]|nr:aminomethyl-transferring glycine dehydrogenase [Saprospiraceae bacterium]